MDTPLFPPPPGPDVPTQPHPGALPEEPLFPPNIPQPDIPPPETAPEIPVVPHPVVLPGLTPTPNVPPNSA